MTVSWLLPHPPELSTLSPRPYAGFFHILLGPVPSLLLCLPSLLLSLPLLSLVLTLLSLVLTLSSLVLPPLVPPLWQHAGFFHILLGSVVLLSLGPSVEIAFGSFGFFAAYVTGGVYGNLMSFWETAEVTVGGTVSTHCHYKPQSVSCQRLSNSMDPLPAEVTVGGSVGTHCHCKPLSLSHCHPRLVLLFYELMWLQSTVAGRSDDPMVTSWQSMQQAVGCCHARCVLPSACLGLFSFVPLFFLGFLCLVQGPIYGILAAYLVYLYRNRHAIGKEEAESSLWSLIFFGALNIAFGSALPIDDWYAAAASSSTLFVQCLSIDTPLGTLPLVGTPFGTRLLRCRRLPSRQCFPPISRIGAFVYGIVPLL